MKFLVDGIRDLPGRGEIGIAQEQGDGLEIVQIDRRVAFDNAAIGNGADGGRIDFLAILAVARRISAHDQRPLSLRIDLAIGSMESAQQEHAAFEALGIAGRGDGYVQLRSGARKRRKGCGNKDRRDILDLTMPGEISTPILCMALARVCTVK